MAKPTVNTVVHLNNEVTIEAVRVPSESKDFVSLKFGWDTSVLLFNPDQAKAVADAAVAAYRLLKQIEADEAAAAYETALAEQRDYSYIERCTISNPCQDCRDLEDSYDEYEPQF
jgi:hypothetical protein